MNQRVDRLRESLDEPLLVTAPENVRYLSGFVSSNAALLVEPERVRLFTDFRYAEGARALEPTGWKIFDPKEPRELKVDWCKPPWMLTLTRAASFDDPPPRHRHSVRLQWSRGFTPDRCPFPD